jgi:hypothetical protein
MAKTRGNRGKRQPNGVAPPKTTKVRAARSAATQRDLHQKGHALNVQERIIPVEGNVSGVFRVSPDEPALPTLQALASHYEMWQVAGSLKIEWVPMTRQVEGTVAMRWSVATSTLQWGNALEAAADPDAVVGMISNTHTMRRQPRTSDPCLMQAAAGYLTYAVSPAEMPTGSNRAPLLGFFRLTFAAVLSHPLGRMRQLARALPMMDGAEERATELARRVRSQVRGEARGGNVRPSPSPSE